MPRVIICFDLDGTLVRSDRSIHADDILTLSEATDYLFVPASGRTLSSVKRLLARNGLFENQPIPFPLVLQNGAVVYTGGESLLTQITFSEEIRDQFIKILESYSQVNHLFITLDEIHSLFPNDFSLGMIEQLDFSTLPFVESSKNQNFTKVNCISTDNSALNAILEQVREIGAEAAFSMDGVLEINPVNVNKADGIKTLISHLGWDDAILYAVGDGENDLPMLEMADYSFAPLNSTETIKSKVNWLIDPQRAGILKPLIDGTWQRPI